MNYQSLYSSFFRSKFYNQAIPTFRFKEIG